MLQPRVNQYAPHTAISIQKRVDRLKLQMDQCRLHLRRQGLQTIVMVMDEPLQVCQQSAHPFGTWEHKSRVSRQRGANLVLRVVQFTRRLAVVAHTVHQQTVCITPQTHVQGQAGRVMQLRLHQPKGTQVVGKPFHISESHNLTYVPGRRSMKKVQTRHSRRWAGDVGRWEGLFETVQLDPCRRLARMPRPMRHPSR